MLITLLLLNTHNYEALLPIIEWSKRRSVQYGRLELLFHALRVVSRKVQKSECVPHRRELPLHYQHR